jgi:hypothetical protein
MLCDVNLQPAPEMPQYISDDFHKALTLRAQQGVHLVYFLDQVSVQFLSPARLSSEMPLQVLADFSWTEYNLDHSGAPLCNYFLVPLSKR